ncbi:MAG: hypothetical protein KJ668_08080 [Proteobacteria bacterium]|nr:hypothetical protein [Pseudomonadota bacterium]
MIGPEEQNIAQHRWSIPMDRQLFSAADPGCQHNKKITVSYEFRRYEPIFIAQADNSVEYHLEIDQKTGNGINVFGKNVDVKKGFYPAFQPLNSKFAYSYRENMEIMPVWEEQKDGSFIKVK